MDTKWGWGRGVLLALTCSFLLASCGGDNSDDGGGNAPGATHTVSGTVSGLAPGAQLMLQDNGADALTITADGAFTFATPIADGGSYAVAVSSQPAAQTCTAANASGDHVTANVSGVSITCSNNPVTISGTVSGLTAGSQLVLNDNGGDPLTVTADGTFTFATPVASNGTYTVTVATQPLGQICTVANFTATNVTANVANVNVVCSTGTYIIGGTITGLPSGVQLTLENNGSDPITITADGPFHFPTPVAFRGSYVVTVAARPTAQVCSVTGGSGTGVAADVINLAVSCSVSPGFAYTANIQANTVSQYTIGPDGALVSMTPASVSTGVAPNSIAVDPKGRYAYVVTGNDNLVWFYAIGADGSLSPITDSSTHLTNVSSGRIPTSITIDHSGTYAYVVNQAGVTQYTIESNGALMQGPSVPAGGGTFSMAMDPADKFAYVINRLDHTVSQYSVGSDGTLVALMSGGTPVLAPTAGIPSSIALDATGKHAYVTNSFGAGASTVSQYTVGNDGTLTTIVNGSAAPVLASTGPNPVTINLAVGGQHAYVANDGLGVSPSVSQYTVGTDGTLTRISDVVPPGSAELIALDPLGRYAYVSNGLNAIWQYTLGTDGLFPTALNSTTITGRVSFLATTR